MCIAGFDEICIRCTSWHEGWDEVAVFERAQRPAGTMFDAAVAGSAVRRCLSSRDAARTKHARCSSLERALQQHTGGSWQHCQMSAESRRRPRMLKGRLFA